MTIKFENLSQEQTDVVIRIVREMFTFYIKQKIESIMFGFSSITRKQFFNQPFGKTFDFETFENMIEKCLDDYAYYQQYIYGILIMKIVQFSRFSKNMFFRFQSKPMSMMVLHHSIAKKQ